MVSRCISSPRSLSSDDEVMSQEDAMNSFPAAPSLPIAYGSLASSKMRLKLRMVNSDLWLLVLASIDAYLPCLSPHGKYLPL